MCVNSNGSYSLCRFDWNHAMIMEKISTGGYHQKESGIVLLYGIFSVHLKKSSSCELLFSVI